MHPLALRARPCHSCPGMRARLCVCVCVRVCVCVCVWYLLACASCPGMRARLLCVRVCVLPACLPQLSRDAVVASIKKDYESNYFISGKGDMEGYAEDCVFADPFVRCGVPSLIFSPSVGTAPSLCLQMRVRGVLHVCLPASRAPACLTCMCLPASRVPACLTCACLPQVYVPACPRAPACLLQLQRRLTLQTERRKPRRTDVSRVVLIGLLSYNKHSTHEYK